MFFIDFLVLLLFCSYGFYGDFRFAEKPATNSMGFLSWVPRYVTRVETKWMLFPPLLNFISRSFYGRKIIFTFTWRGRCRDLIDSTRIRLSFGVSCRAEKSINIWWWKGDMSTASLWHFDNLVYEQRKVDLSDDAELLIAQDDERRRANRKSSIKSFRFAMSLPPTRDCARDSF